MDWLALRHADVLFLKADIGPPEGTMNAIPRANYIMPITYLRQLTASARTQRANSHLAGFLAFIAGGINAGGFLAVAQYTSHMSGIVSAMADHIAIGEFGLLAAGLGALGSFIGGAATSAILINWARHRALRSEYALPLVLEAGLLVCFGVLGASMEHRQWLFVPMTVSLLCFVMGLQNAMITKLSRAEVRTTHITGMVTDIGIELGKLLYWNRRHADLTWQTVHANQGRLRLLTALVGLFFLGGVVGALGFKHVGYVSTLPLAALLVGLAMVPMVDDALPRLRRLRRLRSSKPG